MHIYTEDINVSFGNNKILNGINIAAQNNEFIGIIGPNGCGKSTLLKCIYRVLKPQKGCVYISDKNILDMNYSESAKEIAVVSQQNHYNFDFSVKDIVLMGRSPHKKLMARNTSEDLEIVDKALHIVGMYEYANRQFSTLSGGEQQRIILARALAQDTNILILDELTNHLDINYQLQLLKTVKALNKTVISAFHDLNIAGMFCDKIFAMKDGIVLKYGTVQEVLTKKLIQEIYNVNTDVSIDTNGRVYIKYHL